jgi:hypothetical protein
MAGGLAELFANARDMNIQRALTTVFFFVEDSLDELLARHRFVFAQRQHRQNIEFDLGQLDRNPVKLGFALFDVNRQWADLHQIAAHIRATQPCLHAGHELSGPKWFREVVVSAQFESTNFVVSLGTGGKDDYR